MNRSPWLDIGVGTFLLLLSVGIAPARGAGLYDDEKKDKEMTKGDIMAQDYWFTKFDAMMLELALKTHQPEGRIGLDRSAPRSGSTSSWKSTPITKT